MLDCRIIFSENILYMCDPVGSFGHIDIIYRIIGGRYWYIWNYADNSSHTSGMYSYFV